METAERVVWEKLRCRGWKDADLSRRKKRGFVQGAGGAAIASRDDGPTAADRPTPEDGERWFFEQPILCTPAGNVDIDDNWNRLLCRAGSTNLPL